MKIVIAPDSFKECLTALEACEAIERGVLAACPHAGTVKIPMADGGEGTVSALVDATGGEYITETVTGPLGEKVDARYGILGDGETAVIEMAAASGLALVPPATRNPLVTTTYGTGELMRSAAARGARRIIVGIGGSATTDGGGGMAQAVGVRLLDANGAELGPGGGELARLARIDVAGLDPRLRDAAIDIASDVTNPLTGERGAARVYGPQKGATPAMVDALDANLAHLADIIQSDLGIDIRDAEGAGAAGGLGAGLMAFLGANMRPGIDLVIEAVGLPERLKGADLVITGEGRLDGQSAFGKTPIGVAREAKKLGLPVIALAGSIGDGAEAVLERGIDAWFSIVRSPVPLEEALANGAALLEAAAEQVIRAWLAARPS